MKKFVQHTGLGVMISALCFSSVQANETDLHKMNSLDLCVAYSTLETEADKQSYFKELDQRGQLSHQDHARLSKKEVGTSSTMCGMYMALGKPLAEQSRQIRPMTFKAVHVYPDMYYVSQSGMIVAAYERKEGTMPPKLTADKPEVEAPPVLYSHPK